MIVCDTPWKKARGLMFRVSRERAWFPMRTETVTPVHSWFVFRKLLLRFYDRELRLVEKVELRPFKTYTPRHAYKYLEEVMI